MGGGKRKAGSAGDDAPRGTCKTGVTDDVASRVGQSFLGSFDGRSTLGITEVDDKLQSQGHGIAKLMLHSWALSSFISRRTSR